MYLPKKPKNEAELISRANNAAGYTLADLANCLKIDVPPNLQRKKGWIGKLMELYLGADLDNKAERDFADLGIELKTIPVNDKGEPLETTFVCVAPLTANHGITWQTSYVKYKLEKVLWIPVEGSREIPLAKRRIGTPILWQPSQDEQAMLQQDWQELMDMIVLGRVLHITARQGQYLQIRPKAANGKSLTEALNEQGEIIFTRPRGFYLKKEFTAKIIKNHLASYSLT